MKPIFPAESTKEDDATKEVLPLTFVTSEQPVTQVTAPSSNPTSYYHNIVSLKVPIAKAESDADSSEDEDQEGVEQLSQVKSVLVPL